MGAMPTTVSRFHRSVELLPRKTNRQRRAFDALIEFEGAVHVRPVLVLAAEGEDRESRV